MLAAKGTNRVLNQFLRSTLRKNVAPKSTVTLDQHSSFNEHDENIAKQPTFSNSISFVSPESDFVNSHLPMKSDLDHEYKEEHEKEWSGALSFSSPENDFTFNRDMEDLGSSDAEWSNALSFSSPESDFSVASITNQEHQNEKMIAEETKETFFQHLENNSHKQNEFAYSLSYASAETDFYNPEVTSMLNERQKKQLSNASLPNHEESEKDLNTLEYQELRAHADLLSHEGPLPVTMEEATINDDPRAIVITEAQVPFRIVGVNSSWEHLCGFTRDECNGKTLNCIQGEETNPAAVTALMSQLLRGEEAGTVLVNYRKDGSKFLNRLRVGALKDDHNVVTHFVGVLKEVKEMQDQFNESSKILA